MILKYCDRCGRDVISHGNIGNICDFCSNEDLKPVPENYLNRPNDYLLNDSMKLRFYNELVKTSSNFDQKLFDKREIWIRRNAEHYKRYEEEKEREKMLPKCPYCQSTKLRKISTTSRVLSVGFFGLASKKIGKQWHCNDCDSDF